MRKSFIALILVAGISLACGGGGDPWSSMNLPPEGEVVGSNATSLTVYERQGSVSSVRNKWVAALKAEGWKKGYENKNKGDIFVDVTKDGHKLLLSVKDMDKLVQVNLSGTPP